jgi:CubicO group peptidase (beta-lactamase class C family)
MRTAIFALALAACAPAANAPPQQRFNEPPLPALEFTDPARRTTIAATYSDLDAYFADIAEKWKLVGLVAGLVVDGELAWTKGYGYRDLEARAPADADTVFRMGSMTKTFTAGAVMRLRDEGKLAVEDRADKYVPELAEVVYARRDAPPMTIKNLLTHSSGLPEFGAFDYSNPDREVSEREVLAALRSANLAFTTNTTSAYSTLGMGLLGQVIARASGVPYRV